MTTKTFADSNFGSHAVKLIIHVTWLEVGVNAKGSRVTVLTANNMMHENSVSNPNNVRGWLLFTSPLVLQPSEYLHKCQCKQFYNFETCKLAELKFSLEMMQVVLITDGQQAMMLPMTPAYSIRGEMKLQNAHCYVINKLIFCRIQKNEGSRNIANPMRGAKILEINPHGRLYFFTCGYLLV